MATSRRNVPHGILVAALLLGPTGCGNGAGGLLKPSGCMPPPYTISPERVEAGGTVGISAGDADCDPSYGDSAQVEIIIMTSGSERVLRTLAPLKDAGGFSAEVVVPADAEPGDYLVSAYPYAVDWCGDTGGNNRLSQGGGRTDTVGLVRASCAATGVPLVVLPGPGAGGPP